MADITGSKPVNNAVISTNIKIMIGSWIIGYIRNITETQARPANPQYEVGSVGPIDIIPAQPAAITLACTKVAVYGANLVNVIANAIKSAPTEGGAISPAPGLSAGETVKALNYWLGQKQGGTADLAKVFSLADIPIGFIVEVDEIFPVDPTNVMITKYMNCWIVRYTRPIVASGDLLVAEAADINAQYVTYTQGRAIASGNVEVVS
jgi:hypothetical protein